MSAMSAPKPKSSARVDRLVAAIAAGLTIRAAAAAARCTDRHARRLLAHPDAAAKLAAIRASYWEQTGDRLAKLNQMAVRKLRKLLASPDDQIALRAARTILQESVRLRQAAGMEDRLNHIEQRLNALGTGGNREA